MNFFKFIQNIKNAKLELQFEENFINTGGMTS